MTNLDGEMLIKEKYPTLRDYDHNSIQPLLGSLKCQEPNPQLDSWSGNVTFLRGKLKSRMSVDMMNLILSGSVLRSTEFIVGLVVYVGKKTKIQMNVKKG